MYKTKTVTVRLPVTGYVDVAVEIEVNPDISREELEEKAVKEAYDIACCNGEDCHEEPYYEYTMRVTEGDICYAVLNEAEVIE